MTIRQLTQYRNTKTEAVEWNSAIIIVLIYTNAFPTVTCRNIIHEKGLWCSHANCCNPQVEHIHNLDEIKVKQALLKNLLCL